jgi:hypothetical protein
MKRTVLLFFAAFASVSQAQSVELEPVELEPFQVRVELAKAAEVDEEFKTYRPAMYRRTGRYLTRTMRSCIARMPKPESKTFVLVADISPQGKANAVEVKPKNEVAKCFASGFAAATYPKPPVHPERDEFPVMMKVRVVR